jgi:hypothetical protein
MRRWSRRRRLRVSVGTCAVADLLDVIEAIVLRPGDTLVVRVSAGATLQQADELKARARELLPDVGVVVIGAEQLVVHRPDGSDD